MNNFFRKAVLCVTFYCGLKTQEKRDPSSIPASKPLFSFPCKKKVIYLTFDDGPSPHTTPKVLALLKKYDMKASFFVLGERAKTYPTIIKAIVDEGHALGNHSYSHPIMNKLSFSEQCEEIEKTQSALGPFAKEVHWFRPPYGIWNKELLSFLQKKDIKIALWSIDSEDWKQLSLIKLKERILTHLLPGRIILLHDIHRNTCRHLEAILMAIKKEGYKSLALP